MDASSHKYRPSVVGGFKSVLADIGVAALLSIVGTLVLVLLFAELAESIFSNELTKFDDNFELWVHSFNDNFLTGFFTFFTDIGGIPGIITLTVITFGLLIWRKKVYFAWVLAIGVGGGLLLDQIFKNIFQRTRPDLWKITNDPTTFSFPSGHATGSFCYFGLLAWFGWLTFKPILARIGWTILMVFIILMVGLSRIYFGVHFPTDVIGAYLLGGAWLTGWLDGVFIYRRLHHRPPPRTIAHDADNV